MVACNRRKSMRYLWSSLVVLTCVACAALVYVSLLFGKDYYSERKKDFLKRPEKLTGENCIPVCNSAPCVQHSNFLFNQVDTNADPCGNFYKFACGKYVQQFWKETRDIVSEMESKLNRRLKKILENMDADPETALGKVKTMYDTCVKKSSSDFQAIPTILQYLTRFGIPRWPNLDSSFKFEEPSLTDVLGNFIAYQEYGFIDIVNFHDQDGQDLSQMNLTIQSSKSTYENVKDNSTRKYMMERVLKYFNFESEEITEIWEKSEAIHNAIEGLKKESERISESKAVLEDPNEPEQPTFIDCVENDEAEWKPLCGVLESFTYSADVSSVVTRGFTVYRKSAYFVENIFSVLSNFTDRCIANYLVINLLFRHLKELNLYFQITFRKSPVRLYRHMSLLRDVDDWERCIELLHEYMYIPLGYMYVKEIIPLTIFQELDDVIKECIQVSADTVSEQNWLPETFRMEYENRTRYMEYTLNNLVEKTSEELLNEAYSQFHPTAASFLQNIFEYRRFLKAVDIRDLLKKTKVGNLRPDILKPEAVGGGFQFSVYLGNIMPPFFRAGLQRLINLVSSSMVIGHEIGHSFDFGFRGLSSRDPAVKEYTEKARQCVENQYSQFTYESIGKKMNGTKHIIENMADTAGIHIIDKIIEKYSSEEDQFSLPGFPYSMKQMLYITSVQEWCQAFTQKDEEKNYNLDFHSIRHFRIIGMIQNSRGFSKAFNCSEGSFMNPSTKCLFPGDDM